MGSGVGHWKDNGGLYHGLTGWHVSVWKLSLPQDLEEDAQLSDKGEEGGYHALPEPPLPLRHLGCSLLASQSPGPSLAHRVV